MTVQKLLKFITGCSLIHPGGFDSDFTIHFTEEKRFPFVSTCTFELTLPLHLNRYSDFKSVMIESIISGPGCGQI